MWAHASTEAVKQLRIHTKAQKGTWFITIRKSSRSILLYFKLPPLAVFTSLFLQHQKQSSQTVTASCLRCAMLVHVYSNYYSMTLAFWLNLNRALENFTRLQVWVCLGVGMTLCTADYHLKPWVLWVHVCIINTSCSFLCLGDGKFNTSLKQLCLCTLQSDK